MNKIYEPHKSSLFDLNANIVILIVWWGASLINFFTHIKFLSFIIPLIFLLLEKKSPLVREHAGQALALNILSSLVAFGVTLIGVISTGMAIVLGSGKILLALAALLGFFAIVLSIAILVFSIIATVKGWSWEELNIPILGPIGKFFTDKIKL